MRCEIKHQYLLDTRKDSNLIQIRLGSLGHQQ